MAARRPPALRGAAVLCVVAGCTLVAWAAAVWIMADTDQASTYVDGQQRQSLGVGSYPLSWLGPSHSDRTPIYDEVTLALDTQVGRAELRPPSSQTLDPVAGTDTVRSTMGHLIVERAGTFQVSVDAHIPVSGGLEIRTVRSPNKRSDLAQELAVLGILMLGGGIALLRPAGPTRGTNRGS